MRLGIFGGSFDPPHYGHLILAQAAYEQLALDRVLWVLAGQSPFKQRSELSPPAVRLAMVQAAIANDARFALSLVDVERPAPHYTVDTVRLIAHEYLDAQLFFILGGDALRDFGQWRQPSLILQYCELAVLARPHVRPDVASLSAQLPNLATRLHWLIAPQVEISAQQIRQRVASALPIQYFCPPDVAAIVAAQHLYQKPSPAPQPHGG